MSGYLCRVLGWGFDVFDGLLFNYVAPNAVPTLLASFLVGSIAASGASAVEVRWAFYSGSGSFR